MKTIQISKILFVLIVFISSLNAMAYDKGFTANYLQISENESELEFLIERPNVEKTVKNGVVYSSILFKGSVSTNKAGWAQLPYISSSLQLPADRNFEFQIIETEYIDYNLEEQLLPSRGVIYRNQDPSAIPYVTDPSSIVDDWYPAELISNSDPYIIRDVRGTNVYVYPFKYNAAKKILRVYSKVKISINKSNQAPVNPLLDYDRRITKEMSSVYESLFVNYHSSALKITTEIAEYGEILVLYTARDATAIQAWILWKKEMGYKVHEIQVNTGDNVKSLIAAEYNNNKNILYVQLVGDWEDIQSDLGTNQNAPMDPMMGCVEGSDDYFDLIIGRFSASTTDHVTIQGNKVITYEKTPDIGGTWYSYGLGIGSNEGPGDDSEIDQDHIESIKQNRLLPFTYTSVSDAYGPGASASDAANAVNNGISIINYCGHGDHDVFVTTGYSNSDIANATNGTMLPFIFSVACVNGEFHSGGDCFAEAWLRKDNGGAIATWMATINQPWQPPMRGQDYANDLLIQGYDYNSSPGSGTSTSYGKTTFGSVTFNAAALMINESSGSDDWDTYKTWTVFGDASVQLRTETPRDIFVSNPGVTPGAYSTQIIVDSLPFENALVSIYKDGEPQPFSGLTDSLGNVTINHTLTDTVLLTVTGFNLASYQSSVVITVPNPPICDFIADDTVITAGNTVTFTDLSINYPSQRSWVFDGGDPAVGSSQIEHVTYNTPGSYTVSLWVSNSAGSDSLVKLNYIVVDSVSSIPVVDFFCTQNSIIVGDSIDFTENSTNLPSSWSWTFDGASPASSTDQNPSGIRYDVAGIYTVSLEATNNIGTGTETKTDYIIVSDVPPCEAGATDLGYEYISSVVLGDINNVTGSDGYADFTAISTDMIPGQTYPIDIEITNAYNSDQLLIWVDWNHNSEFTDPGEDVFVSSQGTGPFTADIIVPDSALLGNARMRIRLHDAQYGANDAPCDYSGYGEVEDYTLHVSLATSIRTKLQLQEVTLYPNPNSGFVNLRLERDFDSPLHIEVFSVTGKKVYNGLIETPATGTTKQINLENLAAGIYYVKLQSNIDIYSRKLIISP